MHCIRVFETEDRESMLVHVRVLKMRYRKNIAAFTEGLRSFEAELV